MEHATAASAPAAALRGRLTYPDSLPITERRQDLLDAIADHQVVIVAGETGSGKSTQLPKLCLEAGRGVDGMIGHTQPRRVAARTIAERIAEEVGSPLGTDVGYTVRFTDQVSDSTLVKVMTDGILLAEIQRDRMLRRYDTLIIDEAHERSLNIDFILGYLAQLLPQRPDLKVIVTSATIDTARFAEHFARPSAGAGPDVMISAPVIEVTGRTFPVELRYRPLIDEESDRPDRDQVQGIVEAVEELSHEGPGDVLVFLSGEREIHDTADALRRLNLAAAPRCCRCTPGCPRPSSTRSSSGRRWVAPAVASCWRRTWPRRRSRCRVSATSSTPAPPASRRYSRRLEVQRLPIEPVSQASANQRAGRCGRVAPGICIRLVQRGRLRRPRPSSPSPRSCRTNLASVDPADDGDRSRRRRATSRSSSRPITARSSTAMRCSTNSPR